MDLAATTLAKMIAAATDTGNSPLSQAGACLDLALGKAARQIFDVDASLADFEHQDMALQPLLEAAPAPGLQVVLQVRDGRCGLLCLDGLLVNALVELMTGASDSSVFREERLPTRIDAALCQDFFQSLLDLFGEDLAKVVGHPVLPALKWGKTEVEAVKLVFQLENQPYVTLCGKINFQNGIRGGAVTIALPTSFWDSVTKVQSGAKDLVWENALTANVLAAPLTLKARLEVLEIPLAQALAWKVGDVLEISPSSLSNLDLLAPNGTVLFSGRLGQHNGKKAILVTQAPTGGNRSNSVCANSAALIPPAPELPPSVGEMQSATQHPEGPPSDTAAQVGPVDQRVKVAATI